MKQSEIIKLLSDAELKKQLIISQAFLLLLALLLSLFFFDGLGEWLTFFHWDMKEIFLFGVIPGIIIVIIDLLLILFVPKKYYDDGGINDRIFTNQPIYFIFFISLLTAISEELLFRGVVHSSFGYLFASILFAIVHFRYLTKPVLLISVLCISFFIGYLFELTENLYVTMMAHFIVNFLLGCVIRFKK